MATVTVNGVTYTDDDNATTGLANGGHRTRLVPMFSNAVTDLLAKQTASAASAAAAVVSKDAAAASAAAAVVSKDAAAASYDSFDDRYLGAKATTPTLDNDGAALLTGALYWNTVAPGWYVWSGTAWVGIAAATTGSLSIDFSAKAFAASTTIKTGGYTVATLPAGAAGTKAYVTDAATPTNSNTLAGGGSNIRPVFHDGVTWEAAALQKTVTSLSNLVSELLIPSLFVSGQQGAWYDVGDTSTLYQGTAGGLETTVAATPVGLLVDKRLARSAVELVVNGMFDVDTSSWVSQLGGTLTRRASGVLRVTSSIADNGSAVQGFATVVGKTYHTQGNLSAISTGHTANLIKSDSATVFTTNRVDLITAATTTATIANTTFVATATTTYIWLLAANVIGAWTEWDNISVKLLDGNHASQATAAARPTFSARVNLLTKTEDFADAAWVKSNITVVTGIADPVGGTNAVRVTANATLSELYRGAGVYTGTVIGGAWVRRVTGTGPVRIYNPNGSTYTDITATLTTSWQFFAAASQALVGTVMYGGPSMTTVGDAIDFAFPQLNPGSGPITARAYQRVNTATDYGIVGFPHRVTLDKVDDALTLTVPTGGFVGTMVLSTTEGTAAYGVNIPAGAHTIGGVYHPGGNIVGNVFRNGAMTASEIENVSTYMISKGGGPSGSGAYVGVNNLTSYWQGMNRITAFPLLNTAAVTNMSSTWESCTGLTAFPLLNTAAVTNMSRAWAFCPGLTSFPLINTAAVTNMSYAWYSCTGLTAFPLLATGAVTNMEATWYGCTALATFPAAMFNTCLATNFTNAFVNCALNVTSVNDILVSINTANTSNGTLNMTGGTSVAPTGAGITAKDAMVARGWVVTNNA